MARTPKQKTISQYSPEYALFRGIAPFTNINVYDGNIWRNIARSQPINMDCITTLTMHLQSLPYSIRAKDSNRSDELRPEVDYHLGLFKACQDGDGLAPFIDSLLQDLYMTPFGGAIERVGYPDGRLYTFKTVDAATMYLGNERLLPYYQYVPETGIPDPVYYSKDELIRVYQSPRNELIRRGWQMPPIEKAYLAIEMLNRGDKYYANLLLDTPEAGLLDLGDMSKESAETWLKSFRDMFTGVDAFKIPVLFEHTTPAKYIPFGRPPTDLMFGEIGLKYAQILCAAFGLTLGDIGLKSQGGGSLSGEIRDERHSKSTGYASAKTLVSAALNKLLPDYLEFWFIDVDDELLVSKGRARSANAVAMRNLVEAGLIEPKEGRAQLKADGLLTIPLPEEVNPDGFDIIKDINGTADQIRIQEAQLGLQQQAQNNAQNAVHIKDGQAGFSLNKSRNVRGAKLESIQGKDNVPASQGGQGEIKKSLVERTDSQRLENELRSRFADVIGRATDVHIRRLLREVYKKLHSNSVEKSEIQNGLIERVSINIDESKFKDIWWFVDLPKDIIIEMLKYNFALGLQDSAYEIIYDLYENGITDSLYDVNIDLTNPDILRKISERAHELQNLINDGTSFYINRLLLLALSDYYSDFNEDDAVNLAAPIFYELLTEAMNERANDIAEYETNVMYNSGKLLQYQKIGLRTKAVQHIGMDIPCDQCTFNIDLGFVDMEYVYNDKFGGTTETSPFHTKCHCITVYDRKELYKLESALSSLYYGN